MSCLVQLLSLRCVVVVSRLWLDDRMCLVVEGCARGPKKQVKKSDSLPGAWSRQADRKKKRSQHTRIYLRTRRCQCGEGREMQTPLKRRKRGERGAVGGLESWGLAINRQWPADKRRRLAASTPPWNRKGREIGGARKQRCTWRPTIIGRRSGFAMRRQAK